MEPVYLRDGLQVDGYIIKEQGSGNRVTRYLTSTNVHQAGTIRDSGTKVRARWSVESYKDDR